MGGFIVLTRGRIQGSWSLLVLQSLVAAGIYVALFLMFAINRNERDWYFNKVREILRRSSVKAAPTELSIRT
jgi:nitrogen fixation/metabolism regulation signal transduction histidine kinase